MRAFGKKIICLLQRLLTMILITHKLVDTKDNYRMERNMIKEFISGGEPVMRVSFRMIVLKARVQLSWEKLFLKDFLNLKGIS